MHEADRPGTDDEDRVVLTDGQALLGVDDAGHRLIQGRHLEADVVGEGEHVPLGDRRGGNQHLLGEGAGDVDAKCLVARAQVGHTPHAPLAHSAAVVGRDGDSGANLVARDPLTECGDRSRELMTQGERMVFIHAAVPVGDHPQVAAAYRGRRRGQENLPGTGRGRGDLADAEVSRSEELGGVHGAHEFSSPRVTGIPVVID